MLYIIIKFIVFGIIVLKMFEYNISNSNKESKENEEQNNEIIILLRKIANVDNPNIGDYEKSKEFSNRINNDT